MTKPRTKTINGVQYRRVDENTRDLSITEHTFHWVGPDGDVVDPTDDDYRAADESRSVNDA